MRINNGIDAMGTPSTIDVGQVIDDSRLNSVSLRVILLCGLIMIMDGYDYTIINQAAPAIMEEWNIGTDLFGWVFSAAFAGYLVGAIAFGTLSDRIGRKKTLILASLVFSVGTLLAYFSNSFGSLFCIRIFTGFGIGGAVPCAITLTSEYAPLKGRAKYVSIMYSGFLIGIVFGGYASGAMLQYFNWRWLFVVGFLAPIIAIIVVSFKLPESARWLSAHSRDEKQDAGLAQIIRRIQPGIVVDKNTCFVSGAAAKSRASFAELFAGRLAWVTPTVWAYYLISSIAVFFFNWAPKLLVDKGFSLSEAGYLNGTGNILIAAGCLLSGFYFDKVGFRWGSILHVIAAVCVFFLGGLTQFGFVAMLFASGFFINSAHMAVTLLAPIIYPPGCRNQGAGSAIAVARIGAMIGPGIGGILLAKLTLEKLLALVAIPLLIAAVLCYIAGRQYDFHFRRLYGGKIEEEAKLFEAQNIE